LRIRCCGARERCAVGQPSGSRAALGASAVRLHYRTLCELEVLAAYLAGLLAVDGGLDFVADKKDGAGDGGAVQIGVGESALGENIEVTASGRQPVPSASGPERCSSRDNGVLICHARHEGSYKRMLCVSIAVCRR